MKQSLNGFVQSSRIFHRLYFNLHCQSHVKCRMIASSANLELEKKKHGKKCQNRSNVNKFENDKNLNILTTSELFPNNNTGLFCRPIHSFCSRYLKMSMIILKRQSHSQCCTNIDFKFISVLIYRPTDSCSTTKENHEHEALCANNALDNQKVSKYIQILDFKCERLFLFPPSSRNFTFVQKRYRKGRSGGSNKGESDSDSDDDEDDSEDDSDGDEDDSDETDAPENYKDMIIHVKTVRADAVLSSGLDIARNRVDELFYASLLRINNSKLLKKGYQLSKGDFVDYISEKGEDKTAPFKVKRVKILEISDKKTSKDKMIIKVRVWKTAFATFNK